MARSKEGALDIRTRLGGLIPLTVWPSIFLIQMQGIYSTGRHSAEALHAVAGLVCGIATGLTVLGLILALLGRREAKIRFLVMGFVLLNFICIYEYLGANSVMYV
ncbi:MAG: hypothetical protein ACKVQS_11710 [Fimbriimonadaceae bacterium]